MPKVQCWQTTSAVTVTLARSVLGASAAAALRATSRARDVMELSLSGNQQAGVNRRRRRTNDEGEEAGGTGGACRPGLPGGGERHRPGRFRRRHENACLRTRPASAAVGWAFRGSRSCLASPVWRGSARPAARRAKPRATLYQPHPPTPAVFWETHSFFSVFVTRTWTSSRRK